VACAAPVPRRRLFAATRNTPRRARAVLRARTVRPAVQVCSFEACLMRSAAGDARKTASFRRRPVPRSATNPGAGHQRDHPGSPWLSPGTQWPQPALVPGLSPRTRAVVPLGRFAPAAPRTVAGL